jgi:hypothetical protein
MKPESELRLLCLHHGYGELDRERQPDRAGCDVVRSAFLSTDEGIARNQDKLGVCFYIGRFPHVYPPDLPLG